MQEKIENVVIPSFPLEVEVIYLDWVRIFEQCDISNETILIGHSCGGGFLLRYLSEHSELHPMKVILVAPWLDSYNELTTDFMKFNIDSNISNRTDLQIFISTDDDDSLLESFKIIKQKLPDVIFHEFSDKEHFCTPNFPELLDLLK